MREGKMARGEDVHKGRGYARGEDMCERRERSARGEDIQEEKMRPAGNARATVSDGRMKGSARVRVRELAWRESGPPGWQGGGRVARLDGSVRTVARLDGRGGVEGEWSAWMAVVSLDGSVRTERSP